MRKEALPLSIREKRPAVDEEMLEETLNGLIAGGMYQVICDGKLIN